MAIPVVGMCPSRIHVQAHSISHYCPASSPNSLPPRVSLSTISLTSHVSLFLPISLIAPYNNVNCEMLKILSVHTENSLQEVVADVECYVLVPF